MKNQPVFLFVTHTYSEEFIKEFKRLQAATQKMGPCLILYHAKDNEKINQRILDLPHYICTHSMISKIGYPTYSPSKKLVPGSSNFLLINFFRENPYKFYWFIEYDVRFTGNWKDFFSHFNDAPEDLLTSHIRKYEQQVKWVFWNSISHPTEKIKTSKLIRSFNPIYRISFPAIKFIDEMYQQQWKGHYEVIFATLLHRAGFKIRDFGGIGQFIDPKDWNKYYIEFTDSLDKDDGSMRFKDQYVWLFNKPRNKLFHPVKPGRKKLYFIKKTKNIFFPLLALNEEKYQALKRSLLKPTVKNKKP